MGSRTAQEIWETALGELQIQVSRPNYRTWFERTLGLSYQENQFVIGVPNSFVAEYLDRSQRSLIEKALIGLTTPDVQISFQVNGKSHVVQHEGPATPETYPRLNPRYVFDSFIEGDCNRLARTAAMAVAQNPGRSYNPLFIYGEPGLGKTHLLHAIGHLALDNHIPVVSVTGEQFTNEFVNAIREKKTEEFRSKFRSAGFLLVDDVYFIGGKEQTEESFFHTFNELHNANKQIVITSDRPPKSMSLIEERLRSRFEWGLTVNIQPPDFQTRLEILKKICKQKEANLDAEVVEFIGTQIKNNIRELEGSLNRVIAYAKLLKSLPTIEMAARALEDIGGNSVDKHDSPSRILSAVAQAFGINAADLTGSRRDKQTALARRVAMYLLRRETGFSLSQIGRELGGRDAAAVTSACKKVPTEIDANPYLKEQVLQIHRILHPEAKHNRN